MEIICHQISNPFSSKFCYTYSSFVRVLEMKICYHYIAYVILRINPVSASLQSISIYFHDDVIIWKQFPRSPALCEGNPPVNTGSPHKGQWRRALKFPLICACSNGWANNRHAGDLRRHHARYNVTVMQCYITCGRYYFLDTLYLISEPICVFQITTPTVTWVFFSFHSLCIQYISTSRAWHSLYVVNMPYILNSNIGAHCIAHLLYLVKYINTWIAPPINRESY